MGFWKELGNFVSNPIGYVKEDIAQPFERAVIRPIGGAIEDGLDTVFTVIDGVMSDPKKLVMVGLMIAFPGAAATIGNALLPASLAGSTAATILGNTILNTVTNGGNIEEAVKGAVIGAAAQGLTGELQSAFGPTQDAVSILGDANVDLVAKNMEVALANIAAKTTSNVAISTVLGKDPTAALVFGGAQAASEVILNQVLQSTHLNEEYSSLPAAAKNSIKSALTASLSGKDVSAAVAQTLFNSAAREAKGAIKLQYAADALEKPFTAEELTKYSFADNPDLNFKIAGEGNYPTVYSFVQNINKAKDVLGDSFDPDIAKEILENSSFINTGGGNNAPVILSEDRILFAAANTEYSKLYANTEGGTPFTVSDIYNNLKDTADNKKAVDEGWLGGAPQKDYFQKLYGEDITAGQANLIGGVPNLAGLTQGESDQYIKDILERWDPAAIEETNKAIFNNILRQYAENDDGYSEDSSVKVADAAEDLGAQEVNVPGAEDLQNIINGFIGTQLASSDNDAALQAIEDLRNTAGVDDALLGLSSAEVGQGEEDAIAQANLDALGDLSSAEAGDTEVDAINYDKLLDLSSAEAGDTEVDAINYDKLLDLSSAEAGDTEVDAINYDKLLDLSSAEAGDTEVDAINYDKLLDLSSAEVGKDEQKAIDDAGITTTDSGGVKTGASTGASTGTSTGVNTGTQTNTSTNTSSGNLLALLSLLGGDQQPVKQKQAVSDDPYVEFDWSKPFQVNPFATPTTAPKMYEGGSIDELLELLQRRG